MPFYKFGIAFAQERFSHLQDLDQDGLQWQLATEGS